MHEKDKKIDANLRAPPKISASALHPGNCKQSVPHGLAIFDPSVIAAIRRYFSQRKDSFSLLQLFYNWSIISNSKQEKNFRHRLGNAAIVRDGKPEFLRNFAL